MSKELSSHGLYVWTDYLHLTPGTPDWELAIRVAIRESYAVLLVASDEVPNSPYVKAELSVAQARKRPVYPLWAAGKDWIDCVPLELAHTQYIDLRGHKYSEGVELLVSRLQSTLETVLPRHAPVKDYRTVLDASSPFSRMVNASLPPGYLGISLEGERDRLRDESGVFVRPAGYASVSDLLDDLYAEYLRSRFKPVTYGKEWILVEGTSRDRHVLAPWNWAVSLTQGQREVPFDWLAQTPLESCGLVAGTRWHVEEVDARRVTAIAWRDRRLARAMPHSIKLFYTLVLDKYLERVPPDQIIPHEYEELQVLYNAERFDDLADIQFFSQTTDRGYEERSRYKITLLMARHSHRYP
jgi:hypothetical protein